MKDVEKRLTRAYQAAHRAMLKASKRQIDFNTLDAKLDVAEARGFCRGLKKAIAAVGKWNSDSARLAL